MIEVFLTLHDGYVSFRFGTNSESDPCDTTNPTAALVSFRFGTNSGSDPCDTTNPTAALAKAFQHCIEAITQPEGKSDCDPDNFLHEIIVVHHEDLRNVS